MVYIIVGIIIAIIFNVRELRKNPSDKFETVVTGLFLGATVCSILWITIGGIFGMQLATKEIISESYELCEIDGGTKEPPFYLFIDCSNSRAVYEFVVKNDEKPQKKALIEDGTWTSGDNVTIVENSDSATYTMYELNPVDKFYWLYAHTMFLDSEIRHEICVPADTIVYHYDILEY